jgi:hypothetical protein
MAKARGEAQTILSGDEKHLVRALKRSEQQVDQLKGKMREAGRASKQAGDQATSGFNKAGGAIKGMVGGLVGVGGVTAAIGIVNRSYQTWLTNIREIATESKKAADEYIALAALQEGGAKRERVLEAMTIGTQFGMLDRGRVFNIAQALQSNIAMLHPEMAQKETWNRAMRLLPAVFGAAQMGVPLESAQEATIQGIAQGGKPGQMLRELYMAGELSARDPETLIRAAMGMVPFEDKTFAAAVAAQLAPVYGTELKTYLKQVGLALTATGGLAPWYEERGLGPGMAATAFTGST